MSLGIRHLRLRPLRRISTFRKLAIAAWNRPGDPTTYGDVEVDMKTALAFIKKVGRRSGEKVTVTHLIGRAVAQVIAEQPSTNVIVRGSRLYQREDVDINFTVAMTNDRTGDKPDLSGVLIRQVDQKGLVEIAREFRERVDPIRKDQDSDIARARKLFAMIPGFALPRILEFLESALFDLNIKISGIPRNPYGSALISNVGTLGIPHAYIPLVPHSRCPFSVGIGALNKSPRVVEDSKGEHIEIRPTLTVSLSLDHRIIDGVQGGRMMQRFLELMSHPGALLKPFRSKR